MTRREADPVHVRWLIDRGVWVPSSPHAENMRSCAKYRAGKGRVGGDPGKQWAVDIVECYRAGEVLSAYAVRLALAALGLPEDQILRPPSQRVERPDAMERQAGDVEVSF